MLLQGEFNEVVGVGLAQNIIPYHFQELPSIVVVSLILIIVAQAILYNTYLIIMLVILLKKTTVGLLMS